MFKKLEFVLCYFFGIFFSGIGCAGASILSISNVYTNDDYGFSITLPPGWVKSLPGSNEVTNQLRHKDKEALAVLYTHIGPEKVDPMALNLMISFVSNDPEIKTLKESEEYLKKFIAKKPPRDQIYYAKTVIIEGHPAIETEVCMAFEGINECNIVQHETDIFIAERMIRVLFSFPKEFYLKFNDEIKKSVATIHIVPEKTPKRPSICQESDIQIVDHHWKPRIHTVELPKGVKPPENRDLLTTTTIDWNVTIKNRSQNTCLVQVGYQLLDKAGEELYFDNLANPETIEPNETKTIKGGYLISLNKNSLLNKVDSSQVILIKVQ